jgi:hypothetical protein
LPSLVSVSSFNGSIDRSDETRVVINWLASFRFFSNLLLGCQVFFDLIKLAAKVNLDLIPSASTEFTAKYEFLWLQVHRKLLLYAILVKLFHGTEGVI